MYKKILTYATFGILVLALTMDTTLAQIIPVSEGKGSIGEKLKDGTFSLNDVPNLLIYWLNGTFKLITYLAAFSIMISGFMFLMSGITDDKDPPKKALQWSIIGFIIASLGWFIVNFIQKFLTT